MEIVNLQAIPNQSLTIRLDNDIYDLAIKEINGLMAATISRNNILLLSGIRIVSGTPLIPFTYLATGNFIFLSADQSYPYYTQFGITQFLQFASQSELEAL